jgi:hypothetical protein
MSKVLLTFAFALVCCSVSAQKIVKNETDEFTGNKVKETSWVTISDGFSCYIRVVNDAVIFNSQFNGGKKAYIMDEGAKFMLKLENDSIITLNNLEYSVGEFDSFNVGSTHISRFLLKTKYILSDDILDDLKKYKIVKVRFDTTDGYIEREVSKGDSNKLLKLFGLI